MHDEMTFGSVVKERRNWLGLTQAELGRRVGCAAITIRKIEANALRPSVQIAERLAEALGVPEAEQLAFVRLARTERKPSPLPTPEPIPEEIGQEDLSGRAIRGFEMAERIGTGGYGVVYRATQATVGREVAVKIILPHYANRPEFVRRFETEAQLVARLEHPHIVPLYDYWREPNVAYLIMRLLRGGNLEWRLKEGPLPNEHTLLLMEQVCAALHAAHRANVIHRDIKPANILLDDDGNAYLADFGIAKISDHATPADVTQEGTVLGSPAYISPEQILAEPVKPQADIYSVGVMLYEMLSGKKPFKGPTPVAFIQQHLSEALPLLPANGSGNGHPAATPTPSALDIVIGRATAKDPRDRYPDILSMLVDLRRAMAPGSSAADLAGSDTAQTTPRHVAAMLELPDLENPYKGLRAFAEADAADFFGRDTLVQDLLARLGRSHDLARFLAVVGPSGSGKSSVVRAGLIPDLRQGGLPNSDRWFITEMIPGPHPLAELESALLRVAVNPSGDLRRLLAAGEQGLLRAVGRILPADPEVELLLVIDQFEEVFTLVEDETARQHFLASLVRAMLDPDSRLRVVITLRADFTHQPLQYVDFGELVRRRTEFVLPLTPDELEEAITGPTRRAGLGLEAGLAHAIIRDIGDQPGMLPLLQYALTELFERRKGRLLTLEAYRNSGGVLGALARRADEIYSGLNSGAQQLARQLFLRLVTLGEGAEDTRRRVLQSELTSLTADHQPPASGGRGTEEQRGNGDAEKSTIVNPTSSIQNVIDQFGRYRLLTFDRDPVTRGPTVEVAHEALLREWKRLRGWLDESRTDIRLQRQLAASAAEWLTAGRDESFLLRGSRLDQFEGWAAETGVALTPDERTFIEAGLAARQTRHTEEEIRRQQKLETAQKLAAAEQRSAQRLRWLVAGLAVFLLAAVGLALFALNQQAIAETNQAVAESNLALSESQRLAAEANTIMQGGGNAELAALLSLRALNTAYTRQADIALQQASKGNYGRQLFIGHSGGVSGLAVSPDGRLLLSTGTDEIVRLWDIETGQLLNTLAGHTAELNEVNFSPDGRYALTASNDKTARLWDVQTGRELRIYSGHTDAVKSGIFSHDGRYAFTGSWNGTVRQWEVETGQEVSRFDTAEGLGEMVLSPDGQYLFISHNIAGEVQQWDIDTNRLVRRLTGPSAGVNIVDVSADGRAVLAGDDGGNVWLWDLDQPEAEPRRFTGHTEWVSKAAFIPNSRYALSVSHDRSARLWDLETGAEVQRIAATNGIHSLALSPGGQMAFMGGVYGTIRQLDILPPPDPRTFRGHGNVVSAAKFSPDGRLLLTSGLDATARLWDAATGQELHTFTKFNDDWVLGIAFSPDGRYILTNAIDDKVVRMWNVEMKQEVQAFVHPAAVFGVAFSPDGRTIATGGDDAIVRLWDVETGREIRSFIGHTEFVPVVTFSPDGRYLASASNPERMTRLWEVETGREVRQFPGYTDFVNGLSFSPDGKYLIAADEENSSQLWEVETGKALDRFPGDIGRFSSDGKLLVVGGQKTVALWDVSTGEQLRAFEVANNMWGVEFSPDDQYILIFGSDRFARLWDVDYQKLVNSVCARVLRDFTDEERRKYGIEDQEPTCPKG